MRMLCTSNQICRMLQADIGLQKIAGAEYLNRAVRTLGHRTLVVARAARSVDFSMQNATLIVGGAISPSTYRASRIVIRPSVGTRLLLGSFRSQ